MEPLGAKNSPRTEDPPRAFPFPRQKPSCKEPAPAKNAPGTESPLPLQLDFLRGHFHYDAKNSPPMEVSPLPLPLAAKKTFSNGTLSSKKGFLMEARARQTHKK
ncbi:MAG: hypothetical protein II099_00255, partial [Firmicutes bacterium]|nr:hypothetical protein [Bacillota bacterium]